MKPSAVKKKRLTRSIPKALAALDSCTLCPRLCNINRTRGETGVCRTRNQAVVSSFMPHHGEEPPLSGQEGSGTIFFSHCNLGCCFCQNHEISLQGEGEPVTPGQIAQIMMILESKGCHNINFVTPTHALPFILQAIDLALDQGFTLPLVYNTSGYETPEALSLLDGIMDIYLPDFKFWNPHLAKAACDAPNYPSVAKKALKIMQNQVGDLKTDTNGIATSGLLIRHLVMPDTLADIERMLTFIAKEISPKARINLMPQYRPVYKAAKVAQFTRSVSVEEFRRAKQTARDLGLILIE